MTKKTVTTTTTVTTVEEGEKKPVSTFILLDRSGSMSGQWQETISAVNGYVKELAKDGVKGDTTTLAVFDDLNGLKFDIARSRVASENWVDVKPEDYNPRGMTPLYDAMGRIIALAEEQNAEKTVVVVMTDGHENASSEHNTTTVKSAIDRIKGKGWEIVFLGASFDDVGNQAASVGLGGDWVMNSSSAHNHTHVYANLAMKTRSYSSAGLSMAFTDEDRKIGE